MSKKMSDNASGKPIRKKSIGGKLKKKQPKIISVERKAAALDTLASGIAQDFNEILTAIMGYVEMALLDSPKDSPIKKNLKHAMEAAERAKDLVNDLQVFSRQKELEQKTIRIGGFVKDILKQFQKSLPGQIAMQNNIMVDEENVRANPKQIQQIVINLCTNACNAMLEKGGVLSVALETVTIGAKNNHRSLNPGSYFCLSVSDTGKGIDEDIRDRIFDPYFTTNRTGSGYGMGLSIVQSIVDALNGFIELESSKETGTVFRVFLPVD
jgi:signal transduction histidine kinase